MRRLDEATWDSDSTGRSDGGSACSQPAHGSMRDGTLLAPTGGNRFTLVGSEEDLDKRCVGRYVLGPLRPYYARASWVAAIDVFVPVTVSSVSRSLIQLFEARGKNRALYVEETSVRVMKAIESVQAREQHVPEEGRGGSSLQILVRCLISMCRAQARCKSEGTVDGISHDSGRAFFGRALASLLSVNHGALYPAIFHEGTAFFHRSGIEPVEVVHVLGPLASTVLLQPEYSNLRGGFLLKLSLASAAASDAVQLSLVIFLAELLGFCAVHTAAHADVAAGWCGTLTNIALSLEGDVAWEMASSVVVEAIVSLIVGFQEYRVPISPLLSSLQSLADADPTCLADEVAFLGLTTLHSSCVDDREVLLGIVGRVASVMPRRSIRSPKEISELGDGSDLDVRTELWSIQALVYPVVSMAAAGNAAAAEALPAVDAALSKAEASAIVVGERRNSSIKMGAEERRHSSTSSAVALAGRRLCALEGSEDALVGICKGLQGRAEEAVRATFDKEWTISAETGVDLESAFCVLGPLLLRIGPERVHSAACAATVAVVRAVPTLGVRLLPFVLYAVRRLQGGVRSADKVLALLELLPELGRHKVTARPVAGVIQRLAGATQTAVRAVGVRLASSLICTNSRTFTQLQALLAETLESGKLPSSEEASESRLSRAANMLKVCSSEPELGLDFVRSLQACLGDSISAVTALALRAIAALCRFGCLDFAAALRIVSKKGKVAHTGGFGRGKEMEAGEDWGDGLVMAALAELCGAGAEAVTAACAEAEEAVGEDDEADEDDEAGSDEEPSWDMGKAVETLLSPSLRCHPDDRVRAAVYTALGAHLPDLLKAERLEEAGDATTLAPRVRSFISDSLVGESSPLAREGLEGTASVVLVDESADPSTWVPARHKGSSKGGGSLEGGAERERAGPSNRLLAALPAPETVLQTFRSDASSSRGLAGAVLWCYPPALNASSVPSAEKGLSARAHRDKMISDLGHLLSAEEGGEGLGVCPWQRIAMPLGVQRYVKRLLAACFLAESEARQNDVGLGGVAADIERSAVMTCRQAITDLRGVSCRLVELCLVSLACVVPTSLAHLALEEAERALDRLRTGVAEDSGPVMARPALWDISGSGPSFLGDELIPLCAAMGTRALPMSAGSKVVEAMSTIEVFARGAAVVDSSTEKDPVVDRARAIAGVNDGVLFWSTVSVGVASEWACRNPVTPEAKTVICSGARYLLEELALVFGSEDVKSLAGQTFGALMRPGIQVPPVVSWSEIDVGGVALSSGAKGVRQPTTPTGSRCLATFVGLSSVMPGLRATGMHRELLQVLNVIRAFQEAGVCGAALCLPTAVSECLACGVIDSPVILGCVRSLSLSVDGTRPADGLVGKSSGGTAPVASGPFGVRGGNSAGNAAGTSPPQDAWLGLAGLIVACEGNVLLPPGFAETAFDKLRKSMIHRRGENSGTGVASMFALGSLFGCPVLGGGEYKPRRMRLSSVTTRGMVKLVLEGLEEAMDGTSIRARNAAARVWGCLSSLGQDERCESHPTLLEALGWAGDGSATSASSGLSSGPAGLIGADALHVAREGSLMKDILTALQGFATEGKLENPSVGVSSIADDPDSQRTVLFAESALKCLLSCATSLRVPHPQMAIVIAALFRGGHGLTAETRCIDLAVKLGCKEQAYSSWLRGLFHAEVLKNLAHDTRSHLMSVFADVALLLPVKITLSVFEEVWGYLVSTGLQAGGGVQGVPSDNVDDHDVDNRLERNVDFVIAFLSGLEQLVTRLSSRSAESGSKSAGARDPASSNVLLSGISKVTTDRILPALILRYTLGQDSSHTSTPIPRSQPWGDRRPLNRGGDEYKTTLWNAVVGLLRCLPREQVEAAIAPDFGQESGRAIVGTHVNQAVRAYLVVRVAGAKPFAAIDRSRDVPIALPTQFALLGSILRWATRSDTDRDASAAVLPHLARALKFLPEIWRHGWLRMILDIAGLSETCPLRAFALLGRTAIAWEPSNLGLLVVGEESDSFIMTGTRVDSGDQGLSSFAGSRGDMGLEVKSRPRLSEHTESDAILFAMSVAAPKAVIRLDKASSGVAEDILARLLRVSNAILKEQVGAEADKGPSCINGFVKGMKHALPVVRGAMSGQFAEYAKSVSIERVALAFGESYNLR